MGLTDYINNIQYIYFKYGLFWSWLYKVFNRRKVQLTDAEFKGIDGQDAFHMAIIYLLGPNWCVSDPLSSSQINPIALEDIIRKYR